MTFSNQKKTFLAKEDRSKKGSIDLHALEIIDTINQLENYYTTSSCSGRVYFWHSTGKKNETTWINMSHEEINESFFALPSTEQDLYLRFEPFILHVACKDIDAAKQLIDISLPLFKRSYIVSLNKKIIVEINGAARLDVPYIINNKQIFTPNQSWLLNLINTKLNENWQQINKLTKKISSQIK